LAVLLIVASTNLLQWVMFPYFIMICLYYLFLIFKRPYEETLHNIGVIIC
jgi:hypothetical protein